MTYYFAFSPAVKTRCLTISTIAALKSSIRCCFLTLRDLSISKVNRLRNAASLVSTSFLWNPAIVVGRISYKSSPTSSLAFAKSAVVVSSCFLMDWIFASYYCCIFCRFLILFFCFFLVYICAWIFWIFFSLRKPDSCWFSCFSIHETLLYALSMRLALGLCMDKSYSGDSGLDSILVSIIKYIYD